ncbi:MAG TPA: nuclear transport factor 2 family protein [Solirubrobacterales bacterium]|nr:nuclear transport factor 2 family protein [Solirubrobacterales bacterium]
MSEQRDQNLEMVRRAFETYAREGPEAAVVLLDTAVEVYSPPTLANSGTFHGVEGYREWTRAWFDAWEDFEIHPERVEAVGDDCVVAVCRQRGTGRSSGIAVEQTMVYMWQIRDGRILRFHLYPDHDQAVAAARDASHPPARPD